jgi:hypothetical protein
VSLEGAVPFEGAVTMEGVLRLPMCAPDTHNTVTARNTSVSPFIMVMFVFTRKYTKQHSPFPLVSALLGETNGFPMKKPGKILRILRHFSTVMTVDKHDTPMNVMVPSKLK